MMVKVFAFTADGYRKEIAVLDETQIRMHDTKVNDQAIDILLAGPGVGIALHRKHLDCSSTSQRSQRQYDDRRIHHAMPSCQRGTQTTPKQ